MEPVIQSNETQLNESNAYLRLCGNASSVSSFGTLTLHSQLAWLLLNKSKTNYNALDLTKKNNEKSYKK